ncbi:MAG: alpha-amylase family protein [Chloroflexota bacterium]|nr:alpha-amylase family protein [Chloroflexota bacterium]
MIQPNLRKIDAQGLDPKRLVAQVIAYGGNALLVNGGGIVAWYPSNVPYHPINEYMQGDFLGEVLQEAHRRGLKVLVRLDISKNHQELYEDHPEWFQKTPDDQVPRGWTMRLTCFNSPYWQEHNFQLVDEIMSRYPVDGFFYNAFHYDHCTCEKCQQAFHEATGLELPLHENWDDPTWRAFVQFRYRRMEEYTQRLRAFIRERNPRAILTVDFRLTSDNPSHLREAGWRGPRMAEAVDVITLEAFNPLTRPLPKYYLWAGEEVRMGRTFAPNQPISIILTYSEIFGSRRTAQPPAQLTYDLMQIAAHGGQPCVALSGTFEQDDRKALPAIKNVYHYLRNNADSYRDLHSPARIALLYSQTTMDYYGRDDTMSRCLAEYRGFYEALVESHVQFDVLHDGRCDASLLSQYDLLILPNTAALTDAQATIIDTYVEEGGHLLASYETALYDGEGLPRDGFGLQSIPRRVIERRECPGSYLRIMDKDLLQGFEETDLMALDEILLETEPLEASSQQVTDLYLIPPVHNNTPEFAYWEEELSIPGLIIAPRGRGKVAYFPWQIGKSYYLFGVPEYKKLINLLVRRWIPPLVTTDAPGSVEVTLHYIEGDSQHALVHLLNATGWQSKPLIEVIPLAYISLWVKGEYTKARELASDEDVPLVRESSGVRLTIPELGSFAAIELSR